MKNHYNTLEILPTANTDEIKKAFRILAIKYHPDKTQGDEYFKQKFIAVREAYEILSNADKRIEYDILYQQIFENQPNEQKDKVKEEKQKEKEKEEQFYYEPFKPFYSRRDREQQETPQFNPAFDLWGEKISEAIDFFTLPKRIGKIIGSYSDLTTKDKPYTQRQKTIRVLKGVCEGVIIGLSIGTILFFLGGLKDPVWIGIWFTVPTMIAIWLRNPTNKFKHKNLFVGVNGFTEFICEDSRENITTSIEVNFNEITDLYTYQVEKNVNLSYLRTEFLFLWMNTNTGKIAYSKEGTYNKKEEVKSHPIELTFSRLAERYWTVYLLDKMEAILQKQGHILFNLYSLEKNQYLPYVKLGIGFITFIKNNKEEFTYKFNEVKRMYSKGNNLHIQHTNFERKLYFFKSGNEDIIPMLNLCNRHFFYKVMELLLGYQIN